MAEFNNLYSHGFVRVAAASPRLQLGDPLANANETIELLHRADAGGAAALICPELGLSGYTLDDLHLQSAVLSSVRKAVARVVEASAKLAPLVVVGAPLEIGGAVHGTAIVIHRGRILGVVPKTYLPNYREFYEKRQFASAGDTLVDTIALAGQSTPFGVDLLFAAADLPGFVLGVEICEDVWAPIPPSSFAALAGATVIANLSASNITIGKASERDLYCASQSARATCGYVYSAAGYGESTTDTAWDGQLAIFELGVKIAESERFADASVLMFADIDVERIVQERMRAATFRDCARMHQRDLRGRRRISFSFDPPASSPLPLKRAIDRYPYVPDDPARLDRDCFEGYSIQVQGLRRRLESSGVRKAVIGVSGGLDSTQALLVAARAFDLMDRPRTDIIGVTMPGFATSERTKSSAHALMKALGIDAREIDIKPLASQMLADLGHAFAKGKKVYDITFENVQAGLRTDYLFRLANKEGGLVVGTGDLSELALGWCTYGVGDHMSHYNVNASVAKTLVQHLIRWSAQSGHYPAAAVAILETILSAEITPELIPPDKDGVAQSTEATIGPYNLHDFFLYYTIRHGFAPSKIAFLAEAAWSDAARGAWPAKAGTTARPAYGLAEIVSWLEVFAHRFFETSQFKRSAAPNGPKVSPGGSLSPRGDWRAPSDSSGAPWLEDIARLKQQLGLD
ncbi:MAG: NAD(+) synthase [Alphaproteobacteria bacterium]|nr:NAD(+) synthase [Alphaproteobacteria bacterium]